MAKAKKTEEKVVEPKDVEAPEPKEKTLNQHFKDADPVLQKHITTVEEQRDAMFKEAQDLKKKILAYKIVIQDFYTS